MAYFVSVDCFPILLFSQDLSVCDTGEESLLNNACVTCSCSIDSLQNHLYGDVPLSC